MHHWTITIKIIIMKITRTILPNHTLPLPLLPALLHHPHLQVRDIPNPHHQPPILTLVKLSSLVN
jgi:hypothetical protein